MGLDQYAYATTRALDQPVDFPDFEEDELIAQWRKHPNLEGWMADLYFQRGGKGEESAYVGQSFNCCTVALTLEDLDNLEREVINESLPETSGFFFGESLPEDKELDLEFIKVAREAIHQGKCVYYTSWW